MKLYIPLLAIIIGCSQKHYPYLSTFNDGLQQEHALLISKLTDEFERSVKKQEGVGFAEKYRAFLEPLVQGNDGVFYAELPKNEKLGRKIIDSGLDTMVFEYRYYTNDTGVRRRSVQTYTASEYILALSQVEEYNNLITDYLETVEETGGGVSPVFQNYRYLKKQVKRSVKQKATSRATESYGIALLVWMTIKWPYPVFNDWGLRKEGYMRMYKERLISIFVGFLI